MHVNAFSGARASEGDEGDVREDVAEPPGHPDACPHMSHDSSDSSATGAICHILYLYASA